MMFRCFSRFIRPVDVALVAFAVLFVTVPGLTQESLGVPQVGRAVKFDISPPLRTMKPLTGPSEKAADDKGPGGPVGDMRHDPDPVLQSTTGSGFFGGTEAPPPIGANFPGMTGTSQPPDPNGDIGPNHYVQMVNSRFQIFSRTGVSLFGPVNNNTLWAGFGGTCQSQNAGDPVVVYDQFADRWLLTQFTTSGSPVLNCVALSVTADPTGQYYRYAIPAPTFPDYPKYSVWSDGYYINTRESGGGVLGFYALERDQMLIGNPAARFVRFTVAESSAGPNGLLTADADGDTLPPVGAPNYVVGTRDNGIGQPADAVTVYKFHVDWANTANSTFTGPDVLPIASFDSLFPCTPTSRSCISQPGTTTRLDILSYRQRPTFRLAYRNFGTHESLVTTQSVEASAGIAGMRWWEIRLPGGTPTLFQEGTYGPGATDGIHRWMGSIAQDKNGNMALGYSVSSATDTFPGIRFTGRLVNDPLGTMPQGEGTIVNGAGIQTTTSNRWGDYSSMNIDPTDDCTFWYTTEYYAATSASTYSTRIASFKFPDCTADSPRSRADFDGDGRTDVSVFRAPEGTWYLNRSTAGFTAAQWGQNGDITVPGDYDADGKTDLAVFRPISVPDAADYFVLRSSDNTLRTASWGSPGDVALSGDTDGDQKTDFVVFRPSNNTWYGLTAANRQFTEQFGTTNDQPMLMDYEGDGRSNLAVFRFGTWYIAKHDVPAAQNFYAVPFGQTGDSPVPADYDGDNRDDIAVFRNAFGIWYVLQSSTSTVSATQFGVDSDRPVPGDYDGDGSDDIAVWRNGTWYLLGSTAGFSATAFGTNFDTPIPARYIP